MWTIFIEGVGMGAHSLADRAWGRVSLGILLALLAVTLGSVAGVEPFGAVASHAARENPRALAARVLYLNQTVNTHLVGRPGHVINEQGTVTGTMPGPAYIHAVALSSNHGEGTFTNYPKGGSVSGTVSTHSYVAGVTVYFAGTVTYTHGTGVWSHVSGTGLKLTGTMNRQNYRVTDHITGYIHY